MTLNEEVAELLKNMRRFGFAAWYRPQPSVTFKEQIANSIVFILGKHGPHVVRESTTLEKIDEVYNCSCTWEQHLDEQNVRYFLHTAIDPKCSRHGTSS